MDKRQKAIHRSRLQDRLVRFLESDLRWAKALTRVSNDLKKRRIRAFLFGGFLRELMLSRSRIALPRDIDIVVDGVDVDELEEIFGMPPSRTTRFGGLSFKVDCLSVDVWRLCDTWAFKERLVGPICFERLPATTFLNIEAVVAELTFESGSRPDIYEAGFFSAIAERTLDVNLRENPFPDACVARALGLGAKLGYSLGGELTRYIMDHIPHTNGQVIEERQALHYGYCIHSAEIIETWFKEVLESALFSRNGGIRAPEVLHAQTQLHMCMWELASRQEGAHAVRGGDANVKCKSAEDGLIGVVLPHCKLIDVWSWPVNGVHSYPASADEGTEVGKSCVRLFGPLSIIAASR